MNALNRRRNKKSGDGAKKMHSWKYEEKMSFLLPSLDNRNTQSNLLAKEVQNESLGEIFDDPGTSKSINNNNNSVDGTNMSNDEILSNENPQQERDENESSNIQNETDVNSPSVSSKKESERREITLLPK